MKSPFFFKKTRKKWKKRLPKLLLCLFLMTLLLPLSVSAEETSRIDIDIPSELSPYLPSDLGEMDTSKIGATLTLDFFTRTGIKLLTVALPEATANFVRLLGLLILSAVLRAFGDSVSNGGLRTVLTLCAMLCLCGAVFDVTEDMFALSEGYIRSVSSFLGGLTPAMTALMLATGNVTSAGVMSGVLSSALAALEGLASGVLFPIIRISLCLSAVSSVFGITGIGGISSLMKKVISYIFGFITLCLSAVLAFQGILSKSADNLAIKGVKFAVGSFVPIVGGAVNEALATLAGGIGAIKAATGVVGAVTVALLAALPIVKILLGKLFLELLAVAASILGLDTERGLIAEMASFLGYGAAVMAISAVFFILTLSMMAAAHL